MDTWIWLVLFVCAVIVSGMAFRGARLRRSFVGVVALFCVVGMLGLFLLHFLFGFLFS
jgi:hypothetical protein